MGKGYHTKIQHCSDFYKVGAFSRWSSSLYCPMRYSGEMTIGKMHLTLCVTILKRANTYCALASLHLLNRIDAISRDERQRIIRFCVNRQTQGIHGRPCKVDDSCYTFWTGAALKIVSTEDPYLSKEETLISNADVIKFLHACSDPIVGGVSKFPGTPPDPTHSFLALGKILFCV